MPTMTLPEIFAACTKMDDALIALYNAAEALEAIGMDASHLDAQQEIIQKRRSALIAPQQAKYRKYLAMADASGNASLTEREGFAAEAAKIKKAMGHFVNRGF
jgi:hypothetical protein